MEWCARLRAFWVRRILGRRILFRDRYGLRYFLEPTDDLALYFRYQGWFEEPEQAFCSRYLQPGMTAFDIGAYLGVYTCLMAKRVGPEGQIHAFEPSPRSFERLLENIAVNGLTNVVANCQAAFSRTDSVPLFLYEAPFESLTSLVHRKLIREGNVLLPAAEVSVQAVRLDDYCQQHAVDQIELLKLDVEGVELEVLKGARGLLEQGAIRCLLFEVGEGIEQVLEVLKAYGFRFFTVSQNGSLAPAMESEVRRTANAVALYDGIETCGAPSWANLVGRC